MWCVFPYIDMNQPWVYMCCPSWTRYPPPSPSHLSGSSQSNLDWRSVSHMIIYMFQCYSFKPSHPCLLPHSPKDCSIHLCLFCCLTYRVIGTIFLNPIYICISILYWCFSFWLTSLRIIGSSFIHLTRTDSNAFLLRLSNIPLYIYVPQFLYPFICQWISRFLPCPDYCK